MFIGHLTLGLFERFNLLTAYFDRLTGKERIIIYGELDPADSIKSITARRLGFQYVRMEDCNVTSTFVKGVNDYNDIMGQVISERVGMNWQKKLNSEIVRVE